MSFIYSEGIPYSGPSINVWAMKANEKYLEHYSNYMILNAMSKEPKSFAERGQIERELKICRRKLTFWKRHPNFDASVVTPKVEEQNRLWKGRV